MRGQRSIMAAMQTESAAGRGRHADRIRLFLLSFLMLFVELALIRWTGSNIVYLSYFSNFVLLGSFLGIGVGFLRAQSPRNLFLYAPVALLALVAFVHWFPVRIDRSSTAALFFGDFSRSGLPLWVTMPFIFIAVAIAMTSIAEGVARTFAKLEALEAYRFDILGSLAGIVAFTLLSFLGAPPIAWGGVAALILTWAVVEAKPRPFVTAVAIVSMGAMLAVLGLESRAPLTLWSPYYKIVVIPNASDTAFIAVNGVAHQVMEPTRVRRRQEPFYWLPYRHRTAATPPESVLIVGAGSGSDIAIALAEGAGHVEGVEIDPRIAWIGRMMHPDRPYQDSRVRITIDDGRAFLERSTQRYDLILFALPDSLTLVSGQASLRLESYLFTRESLQAARDHLAPGGVFAMYNYYRQDWLVDRLAGTLREVFGFAPCVDSFGAERGGLAVLAASDDPAALSCREWVPRGPVPAPATDDHPFLYLQSRAIPGFYLLTIALILLVSLLTIRVASGPLRQLRPYADLFCMGAAFLLLETKNVVGFALYFGTTWLVNALVFGGILSTVYLAIEVARRTQRPVHPGRLYAALFASLAVAFAVPPQSVLALPIVPRLLAAVALAFAPVFLANLVFAERFRDTASSTVAFGANLLGAMVGGMLEYASIITGHRALLLLAALLYAAAYLFTRLHQSSGGQRSDGFRPSTPRAMPAR